jgi:hypothetical protein
MPTRKIIKPKITVPRGFKILIVKRSDISGGDIEIIAYKNNKKTLEAAGHVKLENHGRYYETHSNIMSKYRNKGLGIALYATAINYALSNKKKVESYEDPSPAAKRVWKSKRLNKMFDIEREDHGCDYGNFTATYKRAK